MKEKVQVTPYPLRLPPDLRETLEAICKENGRSLNAEIVLRLNQSFSESEDNRLIEALNGQIRAYKTLLRRAAGSIQMALLRGRAGKIPQEDCRWLEDEYRDLMMLSSSDTKDASP